MILPCAFDNPKFERAALMRREHGWWERAREAVDTRVLLVWRGQILIDDQAAPRARTLSPRELSSQEAEPIFLGVQGGACWVALGLESVQDPSEAGPLAGQGRFVDLRTAGGILSHGEAGLAAYARALLWFHERHRFCGVCGDPTESREAGHVRRCTGCGVEVYPRTDPAIIVLVTHGDRALLGRSPNFAPGMYSTLAGFVEAGEGLETAIRREVHEEAGIRIGETLYRGSQPWPFPQSLMLGFRASATNSTITVDGDELEHAFWADRDVVRSAIADPVRTGFTIPPKLSIARGLIDEWVAEG